MGKAVLIQPSFYEAMKILPDNERLQLYDGLCEYSITGTMVTELSPTAKSLFILMKPNIDASSARYQVCVENGKKGGAPKGNQNARKQPKNNQTKQPKNNLNLDLDSKLDYDLDSNIPADKPPTSTRFCPPSVDDVKSYCTEKGYNIDPQRFVDYYESVGWMVGRNKMKSWQAAVRTWASKEQEKAQTVEKKKSSIADAFPPIPILG